MSYQICAGGVVDLTDGTFIAENSAGWRAQAYQEWLLAGNQPAAAPLPSLTDVQATKLQALAGIYSVAISTTVDFTSANGATKSYQADADSIDELVRMRLAFAPPVALPAGFYWVAADNTQVPFTYADLIALSQAIGARGFTAFDRLQARKTAVLAAQTAEQVVAVAW